MKTRGRLARKRRTPVRHRDLELEDRGVVTEVVEAIRLHPGITPRLTGGDVDADWQGAESSGDEAVGGSVSTPDQDIVDEIGRALGVEQESDAEFRTTAEILDERDRSRWSQEGDEED
jgi:hypothetical protein